MLNGKSCSYYLSLLIPFFAVDIVDDKGEKLAFVQANIFLRGSGGFGGPRRSSEEKPTLDPPKRQPDASYTQKTSFEQVRLSSLYSLLP